LRDTAREATPWTLDPPVLLLLVRSLALAQPCGGPQMLAGAAMAVGGQPVMPCAGAVVGCLATGHRYPQASTDTVLSMLLAV
jgi:hypothetical protein